ncbi:MAG: hypothetical protein CL569_16445 [Alphaproteobacteria bacterium]|nr:hypothetical protein [Alphaproteobacteria bacterium]|tara:strand:+ start:32732 stop:33547 length:816 start_codon:yes stop_codon:yes gene_type:complete
MKIVHAGFQKCASTFLQQAVFPSVPGYEYFLVREWAQSWSPEVSRSLLCGENIIASCEGFTTFRLHHEDGSLLFPHQKAIHNVRNILGSDIRIFFVIRKQDDLMESYYRYKSDFASVGDMFVDYPMCSRLGFFWSNRSRRGEYIRCLDFCSQILVYASAFGTENVRILFYEDLVHAPQKFFADLETVFDVDLGDIAPVVEEVHNPSERQGYAYPMPVRIVNRLLGNGLSKVLPNREKRLHPDEKRRVMSLFRQNNKVLFEHFGFTDRYGYC